LFGYTPGPGEPFIFAGQNVPSNKLLTDVMSVLGSYVSGPATKCIGLVGAGQIDGTGAINSTYADDGKFIVGSGGANDVLSAADEVIVTVSHQRERLVEAVPYVTSPGQRVRTIVTDLCVFERADGDSPFELTALLPAAGHDPETALGEIGADTLGGISVAVRVVDPGYIAGEETAAVRALNGGPVKPTDKPPRPFEVGVDGRPTLVSNVETLANLPYIQQHGSAAFREQGTSRSSGTLLVTITGADRPPGLYEVPHGLPVTDLLALHGVSNDRVRGALMGGYFAGLLNRDVLDATVDHETFQRLGSGLGCGAISVITDDCPVALAASVLAYFDRENAGQCGSCFNGTAAMAAAAGALRDGVATDEDLSRLRRWSVVLRGRGACATLDAATNIAASLLDQFPNAVQHHLDNACQTCQLSAFRADRPYEVEGVSQA